MSKKRYYSPPMGRHFNLKMINRICKKFKLEYSIDKSNQTVWFLNSSK